MTWDAPESTIMLIYPGISSLHIAIVSSLRLIVSAMSSLLVLDDIVNALVSIVCVSRLSRFDLFRQGDVDPAVV